jgi:VWFA-related protein
MSARAFACALAAIAVIGLAASRGLTSPQDPARSSQTFRTGTDAVTVDVSVRAGGKMVGDLSASDFVLLDNGVQQRIDNVESAPMPIDVTLVADVSGDQRGSWIEPEESAKVPVNFDARVQQIARLLRPDDRLRAIAVDTYVHEVFGLKAPSAVPPVRAVRNGGLSALYDAIIAAMLQPVGANRRHVVLVATKGRDTISTATPEAIRFIADRSDVLLHIVTMETEADNDVARARSQCANQGLCTPTRRFWVPFTRNVFDSTPVEGGGFNHPLTPAGNVLAEASTLSGGALHRAAMFSSPSTGGVFREAFDAFRQSYQLRYTPQGVKREGWHTLAVTVPRIPDAQVRARRGYSIDVSPASAAPTARPPMPTTFDEFVDAYTRSDYTPVARALRSWPDPSALIRRLDEGGNPWPAAPRREAVFALELTEAGMFSKQPVAHEYARRLLNRFHRLLRHPFEADAFERDWLWAEITILEGTIRPLVTQSFINYALERFPDDPRFLLAKAIATDQMFPFIGAVPTAAQSPSGTATAEHVAKVTAQYLAVMKFPETTPEAHVRLGWFLHRVGRDDEALEQLDAVQDASSPDRALRYLRQLFRGHVLVGLGRDNDAIAAYRAALALWPDAQSPQVSLMNSLLKVGNRAEADELAEGIQTAPMGTDPWFSYWLGDYRFFPNAMARLREQIR